MIDVNEALSIKHRIDEMSFDINRRFLNDQNFIRAIEESVAGKVNIPKTRGIRFGQKRVDTFSFDLSLIVKDNFPQFLIQFPVMHNLRVYTEHSERNNEKLHSISSIEDLFKSVFKWDPSFFELGLLPQNHNKNTEILEYAKECFFDLEETVKIVSNGSKASDIISCLKRKGLPHEDVLKLAQKFGVRINATQMNLNL